MRTGKDWIIVRGCVGVQSSVLLWRTEHVTVQTGRRSSWNESEVRLRKASKEAGRSHGVLCSQLLSVRNQQIGPDPERPAWVHEMEPERIHPAVYLVSESAPKRRRIVHICGGNADLSRWAAHKCPTQIDPKHARTRFSVFTPYLSEFWFWCTGSPDLKAGYLIQC